MGNSVPPERVAYQMSLQTADFFRALKNELMESTTHVQIMRGGVVGLQCFTEHIRRANNNMIVPFNPRILTRIMTHVNEFVRTVVRRPSRNRPICIELGILIGRLITGRVITHPFETIIEE